MITAEELIAYADGELDGADRARIEAALAADPALAAKVDKQRALRAKLARAYAPIADEAAPQRLVDVAHGARRVVPDREPLQVPLAPHTKTLAFVERRHRPPRAPVLALLGRHRSAHGR